LARSPCAPTSTAQAGTPYVGSMSIGPGSALVARQSDHQAKPRVPIESGQREVAMRGNRRLRFPLTLTILPAAQPASSVGRRG
jgi:hypothetical protein